MTSTGVQGARTPGRVRHGATPWPTARALAAQAARLPAARVPLAEALGAVLAVDLVALGALPADDNAAMDGWAVSGAPPWRVVGELAAGQAPRRRLRPGECLRIATGATVPAGGEAVLPVEESHLDDGSVRPAAGRPDDGHPRAHIRRSGEEARRGDLLLPAGTVVTPPVLGLAAAAGHDNLQVVRPPTVAVLVLGDELLGSGLGGAGRTRDALGPQLPGWLGAFGATTRSVQRLADDLPTLVDTLGHCTADVVVTTGGTSVGPRDHVRRAVHGAGGRLVVDGVDVKPGHPMLLGSLPGGRWLVGLPGNPLAACVAMLTLVEPLTAALAGRHLRPPTRATLATDQPPRPGDGHRLLPVLRGAAGVAQPLPSCGSAMLRGLAGATGLAVLGPHGACAGDLVTYLSLPWDRS